MKSTLFFMVLGLSLSMMGCVGQDGERGPAGTPAPVPGVTPLDADIAALTKDENDYRLGLGQSALTNGLSCTLYTITGGDRIQASIAGHNTLTGISQVATYLYAGAFNQPDSSTSTTLNVLPPPLRSIYTNMYLLRCQGQLVVTTTGYYGFELMSDDGSVLYIDGVKVIDNDNNHGAVTVAGSKYLRRGVHTIRLDYAQSGGGNQALMLTSGGTSIDAKFYLH